MIGLVQRFGRENVYVSIYESGSWDGTKKALQQLDVRLAEPEVPRTIILSEKTHAEELAEEKREEGWVDDSSGHRRLRRIPWLADLRNTALKPLESSEKPFDEILWLNDVVFQVRSAAPRIVLCTQD